MAAWPTARPVGTEPVNETLLVPGCSISPLPTWPPPVSTFRAPAGRPASMRSEEHTSELQSLMRLSYAVFCLTKNTKSTQRTLDKLIATRNHHQQPIRHI